MKPKRLELLRPNLYVIPDGPWTGLTLKMYAQQSL
jgi:hypothetical protein